MFMTVKQTAEKWGLSERRVRILCSTGRIPGVYQEGRAWKIPVDAVKPADRRFKSAESLLEAIDRKKAELDACRPLTEGELARLSEEFTVEFTYNSNAIEGSTLTLRAVSYTHLDVYKRQMHNHPLHKTLFFSSFHFSNSPP